MRDQSAVSQSSSLLSDTSPFPTPSLGAFCVPKRMKNVIKTHTHTKNPFHFYIHLLTTPKTNLMSSQREKCTYWQVGTYACVCLCKRSFISVGRYFLDLRPVDWGGIMFYKQMSWFFVALNLQCCHADSQACPIFDLACWQMKYEPWGLSQSSHQ